MGSSGKVICEYCTTIHRFKDILRKFILSFENDWSIRGLGGPNVEPFFTQTEKQQIIRQIVQIMIQGTKIGMNIPLGSLIGKITFATWKFKMAAIFQNGCNNRHDHIKFNRIVQFQSSLCPFICFRGCRSWIYNSKATRKLASIISSSLGQCEI